jgi:transcriptional regulator
MYQPKKYKKQDPQYIFNFIKQHPFATLVIHGETLLATHIPVLIKGDAEDFKLFAHIANHNEMLEHIKAENNALLIFQGAHGYVSSSWYQEKDISTWDYSAVHVNVKIKLQTQEELAHSLEELVENFERTQDAPLFYKDIPKSMLLEHLPLITGFWCEPQKIIGVAKLHQSYGKEDIKSTINHLEKSDNPMDGELAKDIKKENDVNS